MTKRRFILPETPKEALMKKATAWSLLPAAVAACLVLAVCRGGEKKIVIATPREASALESRRGPRGRRRRSGDALRRLPFHRESGSPVLSSRRRRAGQPRPGGAAG